MKYVVLETSDGRWMLCRVDERGTVWSVVTLGDRREAEMLRGALA